MPKDFLQKRRYLLLLAIGLVIIFTLVGFITPYFRVFQSPDTALAFFAFFFVFSQWSQQFTGLRGVAYMLDERRNKVDKQKYPRPDTRGGFRKTMPFWYWSSIVFMLFLAVQLVIGTFKDYQNEHTLERIDITLEEMRAENKENTQAIIDAIRELKQNGNTNEKPKE